MITKKALTGSVIESFRLLNSEIGNDPFGKRGVNEKVNSVFVSLTRR